jgi:hypothetical protein
VTARLRHLISRACLVAGAGATALAAFLSVLGDGFFDPITFGDRVAASLEQPAVAAVAADWMTTALLEQKPDLTPFRPLVLAAAHGLATTPAFRGVVRTGARSAHQGVFAEGTRRAVLSVPDVGILLRSALEQGHPELAERIPERLQAVAAVLGDDMGTTLVVELWELRSYVETLAFATGAAGLLLLVVGAGLQPDRHRGFADAGVALMAAGVAAWAALPLGGILLGQLAAPARAPALQGLWSTFFGELGSWGVLFGGLGLLLAAASSSLLESWDPATWARDRLRALAEVSETRRGRLGRGTAVLLTGVLAISAPQFVATAGVVVVGATLAFLGARELFGAVAEAAEANPVAARVQVRGLAGTLAVVGLALALGAVWLVRRSPAVLPDPTSVSACNGSQALCDRRLDEVSLAGTHNAMSHVETPDWLFPHHQAGIPRQLQDGIRALLIDVHYGFPGASRIKTDLGGERPTEAALEEALGAEGVAAAYRIRDRLIGEDPGRRGLYLCHGLCEIGAYELEPTLRQIRSFLVQRPDAVLVIVIEDYVSPEDLAAAFEESGLAQLVYTGPAPPWPTLRQLVRAGRPVLVFLESGRPGVPWLRPAFENIQETPYTFHSPEEFSCRPNRGGSRGSLFQINHWIETTPTPLPSNAERVNAYEPLLARARECQEERQHLPNVLAVDFYRSGDVLRVVDTLNGLGPGSAP